MGKALKSYSKVEIASWPENHKPCNRCEAMLPLDSFTANPAGIRGAMATCKPCRSLNNKQIYNAATPAERIYKQAKARANRDCIPFTIELSDIYVPDVCPALGIPLFKGEGRVIDNSPSIDRIDPSRGYIPGNVVIISNKANRIKSNANLEEIEKVASWLRTVL